MMLTDKSIFEWPFEDRQKLYNEILSQLNEKFDIFHYNVNNIYAAGSRVMSMALPETASVKPFTEKSDLDILIDIDTSIYIEIVNKLEKGLYPPKSFIDTPIRFGFTYKDIRISCFGFPSDYQFNKFFKWNTIYVDLLTLRVNGKYELDIIDYLLNAKGRIDPYEFCSICFQDKESYLLTYSLQDKTGKLQEFHAFTICKDCLEKLSGLYNYAEDKYKLQRILRGFLSYVD